MITVLAGGVGAAKFLEGLCRLVEPEDLSIIVNTGDDEEFYGLHVSPDVDIITYTLAGIVDSSKGWGIRDDTFNTQSMLGRLGCETWFKLGDKDLAIHIYRTWRIRQGATLTEVTREISSRLGVRHRIIPMSDEPVRTFVKTREGLLPFQRYFVERGASDEVLSVEYRGVEKARPSREFLNALEESRYIILAPSNPVVSIGTILALRGVRERIRESRAVKLAISPIVGGATVKGPADKMLRGLGYEVSAVGVAEMYRDFLDVMVIDEIDKQLAPRIEEMGIRTYVTNTIMKTQEDKVKLAEFCLKILGYRA